MPPDNASLDVDEPLQKKVLMGFKPAFVYLMDEAPG
jgi:hypothetical protein